MELNKDTKVLTLGSALSNPNITIGIMYVLSLTFLTHYIKVH